MFNRKQCHQSINNHFISNKQKESGFSNRTVKNVCLCKKAHEPSKFEVVWTSCHKTYINMAFHLCESTNGCWDCDQTVKKRCRVLERIKNMEMFERTAFVSNKPWL